MGDSRSMCCLMVRIEFKRNLVIYVKLLWIACKLMSESKCMCCLSILSYELNVKETW